MRFALVDRILNVEPGASITTVKSPTLSEEYLQDHFPHFPVMPGVLMLEAMFQASAWLIRITDDFAASLVLLKEARNVKYNGFVLPGQQLRVQAEILKRQDNETRIKAVGQIDGEGVVSARLVIEQSNYADTDPQEANIDALIKQQQKKELAQLLTTANPLHA